MTEIKICGVTDIANAAEVATSGVQWLGINFWRESKRYVDRIRARSIRLAAKNANPDIKIVGVFVNHSARKIEAAIEAAQLEFVQLHGEESPVFAHRFGDACIKALPMSRQKDVGRVEAFECSHVLFDSSSAGRGGSGDTADWGLAANAAASRSGVFLAGGLTPDNVGEAIRLVKPFAVDVASGVESSPGLKDPELVARFVDAVREAQ
ncbi:MAG: phosphoribosylanthranilate isomerase [Myxococcales bacterium]|nr:phosphoribosylanthranilate isomerase [Myxococcales bacterium]